MSVTIDTRGLKKRLTKEFKGKVVASTDCPYAPYLEYGTSKMPPRPFLRGQIKRVKLRGRTMPAIFNNCKNDLVKGIRKRIKEQGLVDTGRLLNSIEGRVER